MGEHQILGQQAGLITREQALAAGISSSAIQRRVSTREWRPVLPGVYRHVAAQPGGDLMVRAAHLWLGPTAVLSGMWAAWWHDLSDEPTGPVTMTMPLASGARSRSLVRIRRRDLNERDVIALRGVPVIRRALAALECARQRDGRAVFDRALQTHVAVADLQGSMIRFANATGATAARLALDEAMDGTVSHPERALIRGLRSAGVTGLKAGLTVYASGRRCWLDLSVPDLKLDIEVDGHKAHSDPAQFEKDRARQNDLINAGWTVLRYTARQIESDLPTVIAEILAVIARLAESRG